MEKMYLGCRKRRKYRIIWVYAVLFFLMIGGIMHKGILTVYAEEDHKERVVRVGYYTAPGFQEYDPETDTYSGSSYEYLMALNQYTNWTFEFVPVEFSNGVEMLENGELDLMNNVSKTEEREEKLGFSDYESGNNCAYIVVRQSDTIHANNDYQAIEKMTVGIRKNSIFQSYFEEFCAEHNVATPSLVIYDSGDEMTAALERGDIDGKIVSSSYQDNCRVIAKFAPMNYYFAVPKAENELLQELNEAMVSIQTDMPEFSQKIYDKYEVVKVEQQVVLSEAEKAFIAQHPVVTVAGAGDWYPIFYKTGDEEYTGPLMEIYRRIEETSGLSFDFKYYEKYEDALEAVKSGEADMITEFPYDFVFANQWKVQLSDWINAIEIYRVMRENNKGEIQKIAVFGQTYLETQVRQIYGEDVSYVPYKDVDSAIEAVMNGEVDATFINYYTSMRFQNKGKYITLKYILIPSLEYNFCLGMSNQSQKELKSIIGKGIHTMDQSYIETLFQTAAGQEHAMDIRGQIYQNPGLFILLFSCIAASMTLMIAFFIYSQRMKKKNIELQRAKQEQSHFLSRMSHDMRTPMNGILGLSYLMEKENDLRVVKEYIPELQESSSYLLRLINDVLDMNRLEAGNMHLNPAVCSEENVFKGIVCLIKPLLVEKNIDFHFETEGIVWKWVMLDEQRIKQIFVNILSNAVKFTPDGGHVDFIVKRIEETQKLLTTKFIIRDNGVGISETFLPHIFEAFSQEDEKCQDHTMGTGLGLSIVKQLVTLMNGDIAVESTKGSETIFTLSLSYGIADDPAVEEKKMQENQKIRPGQRILMCEDHPVNAKIVAKLLEIQSAKITWAKDGAEGVKIFEESDLGSFDVILMDIRMPVMDGLEATRAIRALKRADAQTIPIIAMSANAYEEDIKHSLDAGMNEHLAKPIDPVKLYETIAKYVG